MYGEIYKAIGMNKKIKQIFPEPGSPIGFEANAYIYPLTMMFIGGGKYIEDILKIKADKGLRKICKMKKVPMSDAVGNWLRRDGEQKKEYVKEVNGEYVVRVLKKTKEEKFTLDPDTMGIEAEKKQAMYTYKGYKGYMPILGFIPELVLCVGYEFREWNIAPVTKNYEFIKEIMELVKKTGKRISRVRIDAAGYQAEVINYVEKEEAKYTITVSKDVSVKEAIFQIKEWKKLKNKEGKDTGREYAEFIHSMDKTDKAFRVIVQRWTNPQPDLFGEEEKHCYHGIATNYLEEEKNAKEVIWWHSRRSNSENYNKEVKIGFNGSFVNIVQLSSESSVQEKIA